MRRTKKSKKVSGFKDNVLSNVKKSKSEGTKKLQTGNIMHSAKELSFVLGGEGSDGQYIARCPAHNDKTPSLSIKDGDGFLLLHCHAGCSYESIVESLKRRGLLLKSTEKSNFSLPESNLPNGIYPTFNKQTYINHWTYRDEDGSILGYVARYESGAGEKSFCPFFKKQGKKWIAGYLKGDRPLYNLDKIEKSQWDSEIWVVEGEKCADALNKLNVLATTSPGGSNSATKTDWLPLAGHKVIIWPDNDQAGIVYASNVYKMLIETGDSLPDISSVILDELGLSEKEDVYDWIKKGNKNVLNVPVRQVNDYLDLGVINYIASEVHRAIDDSEVKLMEKNPYQIYQRAGGIVRIVETDDEIMIGNKIVKLHPVSPKYYTDLLDRELTFVKTDAQGNLISLDPPAKIADRYATRAGYWKLHTLKSLLFAPTILPDGRVLERPGYDRKTGICFIKTPTKFLPLNNNPTRQDAEQALKRLRTLLQDFPFIDQESESVMLAAVLTALVRPNFINAPMFGFDAPMAGSGKTLLTNIVHIIATGSQITPMGIGFSREEQDKQVFAKLLEGHPIILIDNVVYPIQGGILNDIMTSSSGKHSGRILGVSQSAEPPTIVTWLVTGNNLSFHGEMTRRVLMCTIDPKQEHPENRSNFHQPRIVQHVMQYRAKYVHAALTIIHAYQQAGRPNVEIDNWGGLEDFSLWIRNPLVWLGMKDPYLTRRRIESEDPDKQSVNTIMALWLKMYENDWYKLSEIVGEWNKAIEKKETKTEEYEIGQAFLEATRGHSKFCDNGAVGKWMRMHKNYIWRGRMFVTSKYGSGGAVKWSLKKI